MAHGSAGAEDSTHPTVNDYDRFAQAYTADNEHNLVNAYYERPAMLALAGHVTGRRILDVGCGAGALSAELRHPLPFQAAAFDDVIASLVLHYLRDWEPTLGELRRVLKPGGRLIASVEHPVVAYMIQEPLPDYLSVNSYTFDWTFDGQSVPMLFWRRPLHAMTDAFTAAGFQLEAINEPHPDPAAQALFPDECEALATQPNFLFFVLRVPRD